MKLPKTLYVGYNLLKKSRVTTKGDVDQEALEYFQSILNEAQPKSQEDMVLYKFVKGMYNENKKKFMSFIRNTSMECMVLWTESMNIVNMLGLRGVVYCQWKGKNNLYSITPFRSSKTEEAEEAEEDEKTNETEEEGKKKDWGDE